MGNLIGRLENLIWEIVGWHLWVVHLHLGWHGGFLLVIWDSHSIGVSVIHIIVVLSGVVEGVGLHGSGVHLIIHEVRVIKVEVLLRFVEIIVRKIIVVPVVIIIVAVVVLEFVEISILRVFVLGKHCFVIVPVVHIVAIPRVLLDLAIVLISFEVLLIE